MAVRTMCDPDRVTHPGQGRPRGPAGAPDHDDGEAGHGRAGAGSDQYAPLALTTAPTVRNPMTRSSLSRWLST